VAGMNACMYGFNQILGRASCLLPRGKSFTLVNTRIESTVATIKATAQLQQQQQRIRHQQQQHGSSPAISGRSTKLALTIADAVENSSTKDTARSTKLNGKQLVISSTGSRGGDGSKPVSSRPTALSGDGRKPPRSPTSARSYTPQSHLQTVTIGGVTVPQPSVVAVTLRLPQRVVDLMKKDALRTQRQDQHDVTLAANKQLRELLRMVGFSDAANKYKDRKSANRSGLYGFGANSPFGASGASWEQTLIEQADNAYETREIEAFPTFAFSWNSVRSQQSALPFHRRIHPVLIAHLTRSFPRTDLKEAQISDLDVFSCFMKRFVKDKRREVARKIVLERESALALLKKKKAETALAVLKAQKFAGKNAIKQV
jgi:hypothetical protein